MTFIKQSTKNISVSWVLEDPRPSSNAIYILNDAHDHNTLSPIFAKYAVTATNGVPGTGQSGIHHTSADPHIFGIFYLTKGSSVARQYTNTGNSYNTNVDINWLLSIDPQYQPKGCHNLTLNNQNIIFYDFFADRGKYTISYKNPSGEKELYDNLTPNSSYSQVPLDISGGGTGISSFLYLYPYVDSATGRIPTNYAVNDANPGQAGYVAGLANNFRCGTLNNFDTGFTTFTLNGTGITNYTGQFLGPANNGNVLYFVINSTDDINQKIVSYNMNTNVVTYLQEFSSARSAFGGSLGGSRNTASGINTVNKLASSFFDDPGTANTKGFYVPYFDTANNYQPYYYQWNQTNDVFTRIEDVHVYSNVSQTGYSLSSDYLNNLTGDPGESSGLSSWVFNETFTHTANNVTSRYVTLGAINGQYAIYDTDSNKRGFITYTVDPSDPKILTYHSHFVATATPRNIIWLNDSKTLLGIFYYNSFEIYSFNATTGWTLTQSITERLWAVGRDRSDRIWAAAEASNSVYTDLHLITPQLPVTINLVPENETYNYQGSTINSYFTVEALNVAGERIQANVTLVIDGSTITFADDTKSKIITTSASGTVQANIKVIASGFSQVITSVNV